MWVGKAEAHGMLSLILLFDRRMPSPLDDSFRCVQCMHDAYMHVISCVSQCVSSRKARPVRMHHAWHETDRQWQRVFRPRQLSE